VINLYLKPGAKRRQKAQRQKAEEGHVLRLVGAKLEKRSLKPQAKQEKARMINGK